MSFRIRYLVSASGCRAGSRPAEQVISFIPADACWRRSLVMRRRPIPRVVGAYEYGNWIARWKCHLQCRVKRIVEVATDICHRCSLTKLIRVARGHKAEFDRSEFPSTAVRGNIDAPFITTKIDRLFQYRYCPYTEAAIPADPNRRNTRSAVTILFPYLFPSTMYRLMPNGGPSVDRGKCGETN